MKTILCLCVAAGVVFISLIIGETIARTLHLSRTYDSYFSFSKERGTYSSERNSYGYRDKEFLLEKGTNIFRIICIGDSVTEGYRVELKNTFVKILERELSSICAECLNMGIGGNSTSDNIVSIKRASELNPDLVIYQLGLNDIEGFEHREKKEVKQKGGNLNLKTLLRKSVLYLALAERYNYLKLKAGGRNWAFCEWNITDAMWEKEFIKLKEAFSEIEGNTGILFIYLPYDFQIYSDREETLVPAQRLSAFCKKQDYWFIDFTRIFKEKQQKSDLFLDDCHLSFYGHEIAASYLAAFVLNEIVPNLRTRRAEFHGL